MEISHTRSDLYHYGIKGMRWGIRRYQTKDGSLTKAGQKRYSKEMEKLKTEKKRLRNEELTKKKMAKLEQTKADIKSMKKVAKDELPTETPEQKKERLLKSTNAKELYENRDLLSTYELNDRLNRIDMEARLQGKIIDTYAKTGMEYVNDKLQSGKRTLDNVTNMYRSVDNAYSSVANSAIGKTLAKKLGIEPPRKEFDIEDFWKNRNKKTTQEMMDASKRMTAENNIKKMREERNETTKAESSKTEQNEKTTEKNTSKSGNKTSTNNGATSKVNSEETYRYEATGKDIFGEGTSKFEGWNKPPERDAVWNGQQHVDSLLALEDKRGR